MAISCFARSSWAFSRMCALMLLAAQPRVVATASCAKPIARRTADLTFFGHPFGTGKSERLAAAIMVAVLAVMVTRSAHRLRNVGQVANLPKQRQIGNLPHIGVSHNYWNGPCRKLAAYARSRFAYEDLAHASGCDCDGGPSKPEALARELLSPEAHGCKPPPYELQLCFSH